MKNLSLIASALAMLGLTACEKGLVDGVADVAPAGQVMNSVLQVRTRSGGLAGGEATVAYPVTVYVFSGEECREHRGQVSVSLKDLVYYFNKFLPLFPFSTCIFCHASSRLCIIVFRRSESSNGRCRALRRHIVGNGRPSAFLSSRR